VYAKLHDRAGLGHPDPDQHLALVFPPILAWLIGSGQQIELYAGFIESVTGAGFDLDVLRAGSTQ
jgi:hypothetical protein